MKMKGRVGAYSFYTSTGGRQVARIANNSSNFGETAKRTEAMQTRRSRWGNLVSFYRTNRDLMARAFERKSANLSDYNRFMQLNIPNAKVSLVKDYFMRGMAILQEYVVSDGSLPEISALDVQANQMTFNLLTETDGEWGELTIGAISADLLQSNPQLQEGDQLTFICWINAGATPEQIRIHRQLCEMTIDSQSQTLFGNLPYGNIVAGNGTNVAISGPDAVFGQAIIHSRSVDGNLFVSHAKIKLNKTTLVDQFSSAEEVKKAIASYGVDSAELLEPGSSNQPKPKPLPKFVTISAVSVPPSSGMSTITNEDTGETNINFLKVPIGSNVSVAFSSMGGYEFESANPPFVNDGTFVVNSDLDITANFRKTT